jgi:cytochrome c peroxidase
MAIPLPSRSLLLSASALLLAAPPYGCTGDANGGEPGHAEEAGDAGEAGHPEEVDERLAAARSAFGTLEPPSPEALAHPAVALGRELFWDEKLSADGRTACASCHTREAWGSDRRRGSIDARGERTERQSQTVFNSTLQSTLRWRGDRVDASEQAYGSITGSMGLRSTGELIPLLLEHGYAPLFQSAFPEDPEPLSAENYGRALEAYQATLVTPAPFDAFLTGEAEALTELQREGMDLFRAVGCAACHSGALLGGTTYQRFGLTADYWTATGSEVADEGRFALTGEEGDRYVFRTPMLRNVARTAPYFHDGSVERLRDAVQVMSQVQLGRTLTDPELDALVAFLESLTGEIPEHYAPPGEAPGED